MMGERRIDQAALFYQFSLERPVPGDHIMLAAVLRGSDGYLRVSYDMVGVKFQTYDRWLASGADVPAGVPIAH